MVSYPTPALEDAVRHSSEVARLVKKTDVPESFEERAQDLHQDLARHMEFKTGGMDISNDVQCQECGSEVFIVEYYNTEMDSETILDVMSAEWVENNPDAVQRIDCLRCSTTVFNRNSE